MDSTWLKCDDFPKRQLFQVSVSIVMYLPDVNLQKVLRKPTRVKKRAEKESRRTKREINFEL